MKESTSRIITAFLAGAAAGALLGILFAPDKGSVTRARIKARGSEIKDELMEGLDELRKEFVDEEEPPTSKPRKRKPVRKSRAGAKETNPQP